MAKGLLEWLTFIEKNLEAVPVLGVFAGYVLSGKAIPENELQPYIDTVMDELEYIKGNVTTKYGALRASHGRTEPFNLDYVEIGNEDWLTKVGQDTYQYRFDAFAKAIRAKYPAMTLISTWDGIKFTSNTWSDEHYYNSPQGFIDLFSHYDKYTSDKRVIVGEYACRIHNNGTTLQWPNVLGAVAEAVFAIGAERNSHIVQGLAYAPLLANISPGPKNLVQWHPNLISFSTNKVVLSTSYYVQQLLSQYRIMKVYPISNASYGPLYYVAGKSKDEDLLVKVANPTANDEPFDFTIDIADFKPSSLSAQGISGDALAYNSLESSPIVIKDVKGTISGDNVFMHLPAYSFTVVKITKA